MVEKQIHKPGSIEELLNIGRGGMVMVKADNDKAKYNGYAKYIGKFDQRNCPSLNGMYYFRVEQDNSIMVLPITAKEEDIHLNELGEVIIKNANYHKNNRGLFSTQLLNQRDYFKYFAVGLLERER
jgi:hypothetical protein